MPQALTAYRVFVASPGGLAPERQAFREAIQTYNEMDALSRGVLFIPVGWEQTMPGMGRPQSLINNELEECDYFVLILWDRWGSPSGDERYTSATHEEFSVARACSSGGRGTMREIAAFFKAVDPRQMSDPGDQLRQVLDFRRRLEQTKELLFSTFDDTHSFQLQIQRLLAKWVRDHEHGNRGRRMVLPGPDEDRDHLPASASATAGLSEMGRSGAVIEEAQALAAKGLLTDAETVFARALIKDNEPATAIQYARFLRRLGRFSQAQALLEGVLERQTPGEERWKAGAYNYLGMLYRDRGELDEAEKFLNRALSYRDAPGGRETTIAGYNNLGQVYRDRGKLFEAEEMHRKALELTKEGEDGSLANAYGNIAHVYLLRGDLDKAAQMNEKAIALAKSAGSDSGVSIALRNQGLILLRQGRLEEAETPTQRSLELATHVGRQKSIADAYATLAQIRMAQGRYDEALGVLTKTLEINERIGRRKGVARALGLIGDTQSRMGDTASAEKSLMRSIDLARALEDRMCIANSSCLLAAIFEKRNETSAAALLRKEARVLYDKAGIPMKAVAAQTTSAGSVSP